MDHKDLVVWKKSMDLVFQVYQMAQLFPDTAKYGLSSQMRRAAVSIPFSIAEGAARKGDKELCTVSFNFNRLAIRARNSIFNPHTIRFCDKRR